MERTKSEKECAKLENVKLFNITRADSVKGEMMSHRVSICCYVILDKLVDLSKFFKPLSLTSISSFVW